MCDKVILSKALTSEETLKNTSTSVWWSSVEKSSAIDPNLCLYAKQLLKMPASSASIERIFSNFGSFQNKLRNKLGIKQELSL